MVRRFWEDPIWLGRSRRFLEVLGGSWMVRSIWEDPELLEGSGSIQDGWEYLGGSLIGNTSSIILSVKFCQSVNYQILQILETGMEYKQNIYFCQA